MKTTLVTLLLLLLSGCTLQTVVPATTEYRLEPASVAASTGVSSCAQESIMLARLQSPDLYVLNTIYYGHGEYKQYAYAHARWAQPLNERLGQIFAAQLRKSGYFSNVVTYKTILQTDYVMQISLNDFMQYYRTDGSSYVRLNMEMLLLDRGGEGIADSLHVELSEEAPSDDVDGGIVAMNRVLEKALERTTSWLGGKCE